MCEASKPMRWTVDQLEATYKSAVFAGILPDAAHRKRGGYHVCLVHLWAAGLADDYSNTRRLDESPAFTVQGRGFSAAFDVSLGPADMKRLHGNVRRVWLDKTDPRRKWINAINCWDGSGPAVRYDFQADTQGEASDDHTWHTHGDEPRAYVDVYRDEVEAWKAARAYASVMTGESRAVWTAREEPKPAPAKPAVPAPKVDAAPAVPARPASWTVKAGDTLTVIAAAGGVTVAQVKTWNGLKTDDIFPGQAFRLTAPPAPVKAPAVKAAAPKAPAWPVGAADFFRPRPGAPEYPTVRKWQAQVKTLGYPLDADGILGPKSGVQLERFQRREELKVTKVLDRATFLRAWSTSKRAP